MRPTLLRYWASFLKSERHGLRIASYFSRAAGEGWRQILVCEREPADPAWAEPIRRLGVEMTFLPRARGNFDADCIRRTFALCRRERPDIFHCDNTHTSPLLGAWLASVAVRPWTKHAMEPAFEAGRHPGLRDRLAPSLRLSTLLATRTLPISQAMLDELVAKGIPASRLSLLRLPVEEGTRPSPREDARARFGYGDGDLVILTIGRSARVKGWDVLLRAFATVHAVNPRARLLLVGGTDNPDERDGYAELQQFVVERGLASAVTFTGRLSSVAEPLGAADVFVLPSRSEGYSLALVEALRAGLPCISSASVAGALELIADGRNGLIVPREDDAALARVILELTGDPARMRAFAAAAPHGVAAPTPAEHSDALYRLYRSLLQGRQARAVSLDGS